MGIARSGHTIHSAQPQRQHGTGGKPGNVGHPGHPRVGTGEELQDQPFDEKQRWIELRVPKAETRVVLFTTDEDKGRVGTFMNMSYTCDDLQKTYEELKRRGVEFENPPKKEHWGNYAIFKDSEGNRFVVGD